MHKFDVEVSYLNRRVGQRITDTFHIDIADYLNSAIIKSDITEQGEEVRKSLGKLTAEVKRLNDTLERISSIAGSTGLNLSASTIRNLKHLTDPELTLERIPASAVGWQGFAEILGVDRRTALNLYNFVNMRDGKKIEDIEGISPDIIERAKTAFIFENE